MIRKVLTAVSFLLGGAGLALVVHMSKNPLAFTQPVAPTVQVSEPAIAELSNPAPFVMPEMPEATGNAVTIADVAISATVPRVVTPPSRVAEATAPPPSAELQPCSNWVELGPIYSGYPGVDGTHRVRQLCN